MSPSIIPAVPSVIPSPSSVIPAAPSVIPAVFSGNPEKPVKVKEANAGTLLHGRGNNQEQLTRTNRQRRADARADQSNQGRFQFMFSLNPIRQGAVQQSVKVSVVIAVEQVTELVNDHVFNAPFRRLNQVHIERQPAAW